MSAFFFAIINKKSKTFFSVKYCQVNCKSEVLFMNDNQAIEKQSKKAVLDKVKELKQRASKIEKLSKQKALLEAKLNRINCELDELLKDFN